MKMPLFYLQFVLIFFILQVDKVLGIRCYTCTSLTNGKCNEPFELGSGDVNYISQDVCTACSKVRSTKTTTKSTGKSTTTEKEHAIARGCLTTINTEYCEYGYFMRKQSLDCFCTSDLCNNGHEVKSVVINTGLAVVFTVIINCTVVRSF